MSFNPQQHLTKVKGKDYLEVKWRLVWFRKEHPDYRIDTEFLILDMDQGIAVCQATISDQEGNPLAKGSKTEYKSGFFDFVEKAETGAIGRALATLGYGTQFAPELEEGERIVDSPADVNNDKKQSQKTKNSQSNSNNNSKLDRDQILTKINQEIEERDFDIGEAKTILVNNFNKGGTKDCSTKNLKIYLEILQKKRCESCTEKISDSIVEFCEKNEDRFEGKTLCMKCQKEY